MIDISQSCPPLRTFNNTECENDRPSTVTEKIAGMSLTARVPSGKYRLAQACAGVL
jgi:hypothetical protein